MPDHRILVDYEVAEFMRANDYSKTSTDIRKMIREEADADRRKALLSNLDTLDHEYKDMREQITALRIANANTLSGDAVRQIATDGVASIKKDVEWHTWIIRGLLLALVVQIGGGVILFVMMRGLK